MEKVNNIILESVCAFRFKAASNNWDLGGFSEYFNLIKKEGFVSKSETKPIQISFGIKADLSTEKPQLTEGNPQMLFKNENNTNAIILGDNYISFHTLNNYQGWEEFNKFINKFIKIYFDLGYGKDLESSQIVFINKLVFDKKTSSSEFLKFIPPILEDENSSELGFNFQNVNRLNKNKTIQMKIILGAEKGNTLKSLIFETNCLAQNNPEMTNSWETLSVDAHKHAKYAFFNSITNKYKKLILKS